MLTDLTAQQLGGGINLIDVGASGELAGKWKPVERLLNLFAFEPNAEECERLRRSANNFHSATYLPYAVSDADGEAMLYMTKSLYCYSLLRPNLDWLSRFSFGELFELTGEQQVRTYRLDAVPELAGVDADVIKTDSQGLDMAILAHSGPMLDDAFLVETEPGFGENYLGENTYSQVDAFMRSRGFLLFDLKLFRVPRRNEFAAAPTGKEQLMWCEATWLKDYVELERRGRPRPLSREKALRALLLCGLQGCVDFGYELTQLFRRKGLLSGGELAALRTREGWSLNLDAGGSGGALTDGGRGIAAGALNYGLRLFPRRLRQVIAAAAREAATQPHLVKSIYVGRRGD
ncbi:MAG TPA: FkbM family methyltransferase [Pyrinomonadaceae bacterium]|nr:FkbM family methyltransferase [Pyrinomonadaceae bacterium]